jgi:transposase InsO family protein
LQGIWNPYDNASCESFIKTLKREEIYANEYAEPERRGSEYGTASVVRATGGVAQAGLKERSRP